MKTQILPLGIKNRTKTELPALIALEAIGQPWFNEDHRCDLMSIALVAQLMAEKESDIHVASEELIALLGPDELSLEQLEPRVVMINTWLQKQPNGRVQAAINILLGVAPKKASKRAHG
ncbi:MAG: hypothetical protein ACXU8A_07090 [Burkholderiaceae bacterium]